MQLETHALERTSPKGQPFIGTCTKCGATGLPVSAATWPCENPANLTQEEALMLAIEGTPPTSQSDETLVEELKRALCWHDYEKSIDEIEQGGPSFRQFQELTDDAYDHLVRTIVLPILAAREASAHAEAERQEGLAKIYRQAQLSAEAKLCREQQNATGWKKRAKYLEARNAAAEAKGRREGIEQAAKFLRDQYGYGEWQEAADNILALAEKQP